MCTHRGTGLNSSCIMSHFQVPPFPLPPLLYKSKNTHCEMMPISLTLTLWKRTDKCDTFSRHLMMPFKHQINSKLHGKLWSSRGVCCFQNLFTNNKKILKPVIHNNMPRKSPSLFSPSPSVSSSDAWVEADGGIKGWKKV